MAAQQCPQPLAGVAELGLQGTGNFRRSSRECASPSRFTPMLEDFPFRVTDNVRFADLDPNHHVNNAVYATYFETGRVDADEGQELRADAGGTGVDDGAARHAFPCPAALAGQIEMGLGLTKFGRTSVMFDQVVFFGGKCVASAQSVSVMIDEVTHKPTPLTAEIVRNFQPWLRRGMNCAAGA